MSGFIRKVSCLVLTAFVLGACGTPPEIREHPSAAPTGRPSGLVTAARCLDKNTRHQSDMDAPQQNFGSNRVFLHEASGTDIGELHRHFRAMMLPEYVPDWISCVTAQVLWESTDAQGDDPALAGGITIEAFDGHSAQTSSRELLFRALMPAPNDAPPPPGDWRPISGRVNYWQDISASRGDDGSPAPGVRIGWTDGPGYFFELVGPFDLNEALKIADSTGPAPPVP